jgi:hypothetical protein
MVSSSIQSAPSVDPDGILPERTRRRVQTRVEAVTGRALEELALARGVIRLAIARLDAIDGSGGQDIERALAAIRDELAAAVGAPMGDGEF